MVFEKPRIHRFCCGKNKTQDEEHRLMVDHRRYNEGFVGNVFVSCICLFVEKQDFAVPNPRNLVQTKKRKKEINTKCASRANGPSKI